MVLVHMIRAVLFQFREILRSVSSFGIHTPMDTVFVPRISRNILSGCSKFHTF